MKNSLVVKHNDLIEARYSLTLNEQKIILYFVSKLDRDKDKFNILSLNIREFFELLGTTQERYTEVREIVRELRRKEIIIKKESSELVTGWLSSIEYLENEGIIQLEFSEKLMPYLLQLKEKFTRYELCNILNLRNKHSIRMYELMKQYEKIGKREISLNDLKKFLGIADDEYKRVYDFERFVLNISKEEINEYTDLIVDYEKIKKGRRIDGILFKIEPKDSEKQIYIDYLNETYSINQMKLKMGLKDENFSTEQIMAIYGKAIEKADNADIDLFEYIRLNYLHVKDKARNKYSYLLKALESDYATAIGQISIGHYL